MASLNKKFHKKLNIVEHTIFDDLSNTELEELNNEFNASNCIDELHYSKEIDNDNTIYYDNNYEGWRLNNFYEFVRNIVLFNANWHGGI